MYIDKFRHKALKALYAEDDASGLPSGSVDKLRRMLAAIEYADDVAQLATLPGWKLHPLKGDRKGSYSLTVTRNWRLTFKAEGSFVTDINFEDYH